MTGVNVGVPDTTIILVRINFWTCPVLTQLPNIRTATKDIPNTCKIVIPAQIYTLLPYFLSGKAVVE